MAPFDPSIQSFFQRESLPSGTACGNQDSQRGGGPSWPAVQSSISTLDQKWMSCDEYVETSIGLLMPGPKAVTVRGRIAHMSEMPSKSKAERSAKGYWKLVLIDDTGALLVKLYYHKATYNLHLGQLCTIWTAFVAASSQAGFQTISTVLMTSISPERDNSSYCMLHAQHENVSICRMPLHYHLGGPLDKHFTLASFISGNHEIEGVRLIVCVKSIGARKSVSSQHTVNNFRTDVHVFDSSATAILTLWQSTSLSATAWQPSYTILLLTAPSFYAGVRGAYLSLKSDSLLQVDPPIPETEILRQQAQRLRPYLQRQQQQLQLQQQQTPPLSSPVQTQVQVAFDFEAILRAENRVLHSLSELATAARDTFPRGSPIAAFLSIVIIELHLYNLTTRSRLCVGDCPTCGITIHANKTTGRCKNCGRQQVKLGMNSKVLGAAIDESGELVGRAVGVGERTGIVIEERAWMELFGGTVESVAGLGDERVRAIEERVLFSRVTLVVVWAGDVRELGEGTLHVGRVLAG